jgi:hypothetical protein
MNEDIEKIRGVKLPGEGGAFLKLSDGEEVKVRITSLPVIFENTFKIGEEISLSTRFGFVVWNHDLGKAQIWVTNSATYGQQISPLLEDDEYGDWREYDVKIKRTGEKAQTRYNLRPGVKRYELTEEQLKSCESIDILAFIKKSDSASKVMWLSDYRELQEEAKRSQDSSGLNKARKTADKIKQKAVAPNEGEGEDEEPDDPDEVVDEDIGDEPINLDEIPF